MRVLCINCGSSSLKFALRDVAGEAESQRVLEGSIEGIGAEASLTVDGKHRSVEAGDYAAAVGVALATLRERDLLDGVAAVGHRVVHGGPHLRAPALVNDETLAAIEAATALAPLHNQPALDAIHAARDAIGVAKPMVAVFDTAFYADLPAVAATYALPRDLEERHSIRRYGFHGLAHRYLLERYAALRPRATEARIVSLQLGSGCSATASVGGRPLDTSMGFTPLEGLVMGTRSGDLDPALPAYIAAQEGIDLAAVTTLLNHESGLLGLSGRSADLRLLEQAADAGDTAASLAIDVFCYRILKYVGAYAAVLGGLDALLFGGGIGEHSVRVRRRVSEALAWAGLALDPSANEAAVAPSTLISTPSSRIEAWMIAVDEEDVITRDVGACLEGLSS